MRVPGPIKDVKKILIFRDDGIGDVLNSTPVISALRDTYYNAHISVVARPLGAEVLHLSPHINEVLVYDPDNQHKSLRSRLQFFKQLRAGCYDLAVVLHNSSECNFMAYLSGARYRIGRKSERKRFSFMLTHWIGSRDPKGTKHEIDRNMDVARLAGVKNGSDDLVLRLSEEERAWATEFLSQHGIDYDTTSRGCISLVGIHPGGSTFDKLWPAENFAQIANRIQKSNARIILFNGPGEDNITQSIQKMMIKPYIPASGFQIRHLAALVERCSLFICNDSGPMHIASALKVPTVAIFGPTDHVRWRPRSEKALIVRKDMDCWPCSAHKCKRGFECTKSLPVEDVWDAIIRQGIRNNEYEF